MLWSEFMLDSVTFKNATTVPDASGSPIPGFSGGTTLSVKVDSQTVNRVTDHGAILSDTVYTLYFATEPTDTAADKRSANPKCRVDDVFVWGTKTLAAMGPALDMSALGEVCWKVQAREIV